MDNLPVDDQTMIILQTREGTQFPVKKEIANMFGVVRNMMDSGIGEGGDEPFIFETIRGNILQKLLAWCETHKANSPECKESHSEEGEEDDTNERLDDIPYQDMIFISSLTKNEVFEMIKACNFLDVNCLEDMLAKTIAGWLKGKSVEDIRDEFSIENDYSPEDDERLKKECAWAEVGIDVVKKEGK